MPVVLKKTCDQTIVEVYTCPAPSGGIGVPYIGVNVGGGVGVYKLTDQQVAPREHHFYTLVGINGTQVNLVGDTIEIEGGNTIEFASLPETDAGVIDNKAIHPLGGAYAYDRFRYPGQHEAGKGTKVVDVPIVGGVATIDCQLSNVFRITLTEANVTIAAPLNPYDGQVINVVVQQDNVGGRTATWNPVWAFFGGIPVLTLNPGATDLLSCQYEPQLTLWLVSFLAGAGSGSGSATPYTLGNIGNGAYIYKDTIDILGTDTARLRSITGSSGVTVVQNADEVDISLERTIYVQAIAPSNPNIGDLWFW